MFYNITTLIKEETIHVTQDESNDDISKSYCKVDGVGGQERFKKLTFHEQDHTLFEKKSKKDNFQEN